jgi:hypothetical protein
MTWVSPIYKETANPHLARSGVFRQMSKDSCAKIHNSIFDEFNEAMMENSTSDYFYQFLRKKIDEGLFDPENDSMAEYKLIEAAYSAGLSAGKVEELLAYWNDKNFSVS